MEFANVVEVLFFGARGRNHPQDHEIFQLAEELDGVRRAPPFSIKKGDESPTARLQVVGRTLLGEKHEVPGHVAERLAGAVTLDGCKRGVTQT